MIFTKGMLKPWGYALLVVSLVLVFGQCSSSDGNESAAFSANFRESGTTALDARGYANDPIVVLTGKVGAAYTITVTEGGAWCWTSRRTQATTRTGSIVTRSDVVYLYLGENQTGSTRHAALTVTFDGGEEFHLTIDQQDYYIPASLDHEWAELPAYVEDDGLRYVTHYAPLSSTTTARNYTICYDVTKRIANWVAYPLHDCYMQGGYSRLDKWNYDPQIPEQYQAYLKSGSYKGGGIRGHQCMSNHRWVTSSTLMNEQTYYSTNIMPQDSKFNSGSWLKMENIASSMRCRDTLYLVTGNYGVRSWSTDRSGKQVAMPEYCWKVLLRTRSGRTGKRIDQIKDPSELMAVGFWAENSTSSQNGLKEYIVSVAYVEQQTGYRFFTMLDDAVAEQVKAQNNPSDWGIN